MNGHLMFPEKWLIDPTCYSVAPWSEYTQTLDTFKIIYGFAIRPDQPEQSYPQPQHQLKTPALRSGLGWTPTSSEKQP